MNCSAHISALNIAAEGVPAVWLALALDAAMGLVLAPVSLDVLTIGLLDVESLALLALAPHFDCTVKQEKSGGVTTRVATRACASDLSDAMFAPDDLDNLDPSALSGLILEAMLLDAGRECLFLNHAIVTTLLPPPRALNIRRLDCDLFLFIELDSTVIHKDVSEDSLEGLDTGLDGFLCVDARAAYDTPGTADSTEKFSLTFAAAATAPAEVAVAAASCACSKSIAALRLRFFKRLRLWVFVRSLSSMF